MVKLNLELPEHFLEEEVRDGYTVSAEMKKIWAVELDLLNELLRVCTEQQIEFFAIGGTMLGAARHKGFIPWDDDVDLMMTRENYIKLCKCAPAAFSHPYFFQTEETENGTMRGHAQLRNSETTAILTVERKQKFQYNQGIFIDIFPLDNVPDDAAERASFFAKVKRSNLVARGFALLSTRYSRHANNDAKGLVSKTLGPVIAPLNHVFHISEWLYQRYEKTCMLYNNQPTAQVGLMPYAPHMSRDIYERADVESGVVYLDYEFIKLPVPAHYEALLERQYGNWHEFVIGSSMHGEVLFDTEKSYKEYLA